MDSIYSFTVTDIDGKERSLSEFAGKVLLIVNVASKCGFTPQYAGLQEMYSRFHESGLEVLGFPANNFMRQEPGTNEEIRSFCSLKYDVTFPLFAKISVAGRDIHPLYAYLTSSEMNPALGGRIKWNFSKFLVDRYGLVIGRFAPSDDPLSEEIVRQVEAALSVRVPENVRG